MFSGIVEAIGIVTQIKKIEECLTLTIILATPFADLKIGDSVAVNGVCLTVTEILSDGFCVTLVPETLRVTTLHHLLPQNLVNLERAVSAETRIGGHYVQGHVDGVGKIIELKKPDANALIAKIKIDKPLKRYIVNKGFIAVDGMSITVIETKANWFTVTFIPHTRKVTIVNQYKVGSDVNIEVDMLAKYLEKLLGVPHHARTH